MSISLIEKMVKEVIQQEINPEKFREEYNNILRIMEYLDKRMARVEKIFTDLIGYVAESMKNVSNQ